MLLIVFILAAAAWLLSVAWSAARGARVRERGTADEVVAYAAKDARVSNRVGVPAAILAAAAGGWYAADRDLAIASHWYVGTAIATWVVAFLGSTAFRGAALHKAVGIAATSGAGDEDVRWRIRQVTLVTRGEVLLLVVAAAVLLIRPS